MPWLAVNARLLAPLEVASTRSEVRQGLLGRDGIAGGLLLMRCSAIHTIGMRFAIDAAFLDREMQVLEVISMKPQRLGRPRLKAKHVLEASAGKLHEWGIVPGDHLSIVDGTPTAS